MGTGGAFPRPRSPLSCAGWENKVSGALRSSVPNDGLTINAYSEDDCVLRALDLNPERKKVLAGFRDRRRLAAGSRHRGVDAASSIGMYRWGMSAQSGAFCAKPVSRRE